MLPVKNPLKLKYLVMDVEHNWGYSCKMNLSSVQPRRNSFAFMHIFPNEIEHCDLMLSLLQIQWKQCKITVTFRAIYIS